MSPEVFDHSIFNEIHTMHVLKTLQMTPLLFSVYKQRMHTAASTVTVRYTPRAPSHMRKWLSIKYL